MSQRTVVVGNGVLALSLAVELVSRKHPGEILVVGQPARPGCATLAAGAMLNSFAELEEGSLDTPIDRTRFDLSREATSAWTSWVGKLRSMGAEVEPRWGTVILNNAASNALDDANFNAILAALKDFNEPFEEIDPSSIRGYSPSPRSRAIRAIRLPREGYVNPRDLLSAYERILIASERVKFVPASVTGLRIEDSKIQGVQIEDGEPLTADTVIIANGAGCSRLFAEHLELRDIPRVFYGVGCSLLVNTGDLTPDTVIRTPNRGLACGIYQVPYERGVSCIGATNFISPEPEFHVRLTSAEALMRAAMDQLNTGYYKAGLAKINIGFRPTSADTYPILGKTRVPGLFVISGTKRDGIHMAPIWAAEMANLIFGAAADPRIDAFRPHRPLIREMTKERAIAKTLRHMLSAAYQHDFELPKMGWERRIEDFLSARIEDVYRETGITDFGIPPELLDMYKYGHITK